MKKSLEPTTETLAIARCHESLADSECPLRSSKWRDLKFCTKCGRPNRTIQVDLTAKYTIAAKTESKRWIPLDVRGISPIKYEVTSDSKQIKVTEEQRDGQDGFSLDFGTPLNQNDLRELDIKVRTSNGPRDLTQLHKAEFPQDLKNPVRIGIRAVSPKIVTNLNHLILHERTTERVLDFFVTGDVDSIEVEVEAEGKGFDIFHSGVSSRKFVERLKKGDVVSLKIARHEDHTPDGAILLRAPACEPKRIEVEWIEEKEIDTLASPYTVGIDFGTNGTSMHVIRYGESYDNSFPVIDDGPVDVGDEAFLRRRWPTLIALQDSDRTGWLWGLEARAKKSDDSYGYIENLKTRLRHEPSVVNVPAYSDSDATTEVDLSEIVTWYFTQLRSRLEKVVPDIANRVRVNQPINIVLSLPVLDYNGDKKEYKRQMQATLDAASVAFSPPYRISTILEPEAAACYLVQLAHAGELQGVYSTGERYDVSVKDGETIMVYDSGGGTTDIIVGTLQISSGKLSIDVHLCERSTADERVGVDGSIYRDFAGHAVNDFYLQEFHQRTRENKDDPANPHSAAFDGEEKYLDGDTAIQDVVLAGKFSWASGQSDLASFFEGVKTSVSRDGTSQKIYGDDRLTVDKKFLGQFRLSAMAKGQVEQIRKVVELLKSRGRPISKIFMVGGNSELLALQTAISDGIHPSSAQVIVPLLKSEDLSFALNLFVPRGVCLANSVPRQLRPYGLIVREAKVTSRSNPAQVAIFPAGEVGERSSAMFFVENPTLELIAILPNGSMKELKQFTGPEKIQWADGTDAVFSMRGLNLLVTWKPKVGSSVDEVIYIG